MRNIKFHATDGAVALDGGGGHDRENGDRRALREALRRRLAEKISHRETEAARFRFRGDRDRAGEAQRAANRLRDIARDRPGKD
ncbi:MAG: hypothetical protein AAGJ87_09330 [Pseudomonadota bacterium]